MLYMFLASLYSDAFISLLVEGYSRVDFFCATVLAEEKAVSFTVCMQSISWYTLYNSVWLSPT